MLEENRWKLKQWSSGVSQYHQARDTNAQDVMLPFLLVMKPFCFREKMQNFTCLCSLIFRTLLGDAIMGILVHAAFDFQLQTLLT